MHNASLILCLFSFVTCAMNEMDDPSSKQPNLMDPAVTSMMKAIDEPVIIKIDKSTKNRKSGDVPRKSSSGGKLKKPKTLSLIKLTDSDSKESPRTTTSSNSGSREHSPRTPSSSPRSIFASKKKSETEDERFIKALRHGNYDTIKAYLNNPDNNPNHQFISTQNTPLTLAVISHHSDIINLFLEDPRVNSRIKNKYHRMPIECIAFEEIHKYKKIHEALQKRKKTDEIVNAIIMLDEEITETPVPIETVMKKICPWYMKLFQPPHDYINLQFMCDMILGRIRYDRAQIRMLIADQKKDPNHQDEWGETPLHYAAHLECPEIIKKLSENPEIDMLIQNSEGKFAHQIIPTTSQNSTETRIPLFIAYTLAQMIDNELEKLGDFTEHLIFKLDDPIFLGIVQKIKDKLINVQMTQKQDDSDDRQLPDEAAVLPQHATDKFFLKTINKRIQIYSSKNKNQTNIPAIETKPSNNENDLYL